MFRELVLVGGKQGRGREREGRGDFFGFDSLLIVEQIFQICTEGWWGGL